MANRGATEKTKIPYKASWFDLFSNWVENLTIQTWVFYTIFGIVLILIQILFLWIDDGITYVEILPVISFNGLMIPILLGLMHYLDARAISALQIMQPVLDTEQSEFQNYEYAISNMPFRIPFFSGVLLVLMTILMEQLWIVPNRYDVLDQLPFFRTVYQSVDKVAAFFFGVFIYHSIRQLSFVKSISSNHLRISLFNLRPLQAFSTLTAYTAVSLLVGVYGWILINPDLLTDPLVIGFLVILTIFAAAVFILPLFSIHNRMETEKDRLLNALDLDFQAVFIKFNKSLSEDDHDAIERLNGTIGSLEIQSWRINAIPTWPWRPETAQFVLTAIGIPLVLAIIRYVIEQLIG